MSGDLKSLREELRMLRKEKVKPVSRMKKGDISAEIEAMKVGREETPAAAAVPSAPVRKSKAAVETVKQAKAMEFPTAPGPAAMPLSKKDNAPAKGAPQKKKSGDKLRKLLAAMMEDSESE
jgi:hypothetical protein